MKVYIVNYFQMYNDDRLICTDIIGVYKSVNDAQQAINAEVEKFKTTFYDDIKFLDNAAYVIVDNFDNQIIHSWNIVEREII